MQIWGGDQIIRLFEHKGNVLETDTFMQAITKIENGLKAKINEIYPVYRLFCEMPQGPRSFSEWYPKVYDQAKQCNFTGYNADRAARDAMIMQTEDHKLRKKALAEAPSFNNDFMKMGNAMESATAQAERMEKIEPVNACYGQGNKWQRSIPTAKGGEPHESVSNVIITEKKNTGQIRMTVDMRHANTAIKETHYPVPTVRDIRNKLNGAEKFSKLDLRHAFHQMVLSPESRKLTTFYTHQGLYRFKRLVMGAGPASQEFSQEIPVSPVRFARCFANRR